MHAPASTWSSYTLLCVELTTVALLPPSLSTPTYTHLTLSCWSPSVWSCSERTSGFAKWYADCSRERQHTSIHIHTTHTHTTYPRPHISPISVLRSYSRTIPRSGPSGRRSELGNSRLLTGIRISVYGHNMCRLRGLWCRAGLGVVSRSPDPFKACLLPPFYIAQDAVLRNIVCVAVLRKGSGYARLA